MRPLTSTKFRPGEGALRRLAAALAISSLALVAIGLVLLAVEIEHGWVPLGDPGVAQTIIAVVIFATLFPLVGWLIIRRLPAGRLGWTYLAIGFWQALNMFATGYSTLAFWVGSGNLPLASELSWVAVWAWVPGFTLFCTLGILLFPNGRLPSRRWWPVVGLTVIAFVLLVLPGAFATWPYRGVALERLNALNIPPPADPVITTAFAIQNVGQLVLLVAMVGSVAGLAVRFRHSRGVERQQLKWFTYGAAVDALLLVAWTVLPLSPVIGAVSALVFAPILPVAIGIAILRYRLYDIDRIISRTLAYAVLTAILAGVYVAGFLAIQAVLATFTANGGPVAVAASTLAVFALFQPVRRRIQGAVDRRFYRSRYDAQREIESFAARVRDEVEVDRLAGALEQTLDRTMQPSSASIWLRSGGGGRP
jgi:hypothetical protein